MSERPSPHDRAYRALLRLYPADFRRRYGRAMADFHRDRVRAAREAGESLVALWLRAVADTAASALAERLRPTPGLDLGPNRFPEERPVQSLAQDLAYAARGLVRRPGFTLVVLVTIALGIGANAAIFSVVNGILIRPLPYPHPERVIAFGHEAPQWLTSEPDFIDYERDMRTIEGIAGYTRGEATLSGADGDPERLRVVRGSEQFFPLLGVQPLLGRTFTPDEFARRSGPPTVAVISYGLWQRRFGGDPTVVGRALIINGTPRTVVGVMPPHFDFPEARTDAWHPLPRFAPDTLGDRSNHYLFVVGRLKPGVAPAQARAEAAAVARRIMRDNEQSFDPKHPLRPSIKLVRDELVGGTRPYLLALLGAVGFVLLIACANVANLLLVRGESRRKELAVRNALGASGRRLAAQLLAESGMLALVGGALGLGLGWAIVRALVAAAPPSIPRLDVIGVDWKVLAFTMAATVVTGLLIGLAPAWRVSRGDLVGALKDGGRTTALHGAARGARRALVIAEVALAVVMLAGAGMLLRSLWHLQGSDLGFDPRGVLAARVSISQREYDDTRSAVFFDQLLARVRAAPGVRSAAAANWLPVVDAGGLWGVRLEGAPETAEWAQAVPQHVTPGYFATVGMPLLAGRDFTDADREGAPYVVVVSQRMAKSLWPNESALGRRFKLGGPSPMMSVVGVVGDISSRGPGDTPEATMYFPYAQSAKSAFFMPRSMALLARTDGEPLALASAVRSAVHALDPAAPVSEVRTLEQVVETSVASRRFSTSLLAAFAALALTLAGIGTYGVISYGVSQRTYEIGVRMALGAERGTVMRLVMAEGLRMCAVGLALGLAGAVAVARTVRALLVGVSVVDAPTMLAVCVALLAVAALACALPARRAMAVSPTEALRGG